VDAPPCKFKLVFETFLFLLLLTSLSLGRRTAFARISLIFFSLFLLFDEQDLMEGSPYIHCKCVISTNLGNGAASVLPPVLLISVFSHLRSLTSRFK